MPWGATDIRDWKDTKEGKTRGMRGTVYTGRGGSPIMYDDNPTTPISVTPTDGKTGGNSGNGGNGESGEKPSPRQQGPQFRTMQTMQTMQASGDQNTDIVRTVPANGNVEPASFMGFLNGEIIPGIKNMWLLGGLIVWIAISEYGVMGGKGKGKKWFS